MQQPEPSAALPGRHAAALPDPPDGDLAEPRLGVAAAARRLGVAPATLRTWDRRYGMGPTEHAAGHHRRYSAEDIRRLELMQHAQVRGASAADAARYARAAPLSRPAAVSPVRPLADPGAEGGPQEGSGEEGSGEEGEATATALDGSADVASAVRAGGRVLRLAGAGSSARGLGRAALALDAATIRQLLEESISAVGLQRTWDDVARPVLSAIGTRWASTSAGVEMEHLLSECVIGVLGAHAAAARTVGDARPVLLAGMPGEQHTLPMVVLASSLADRGVGCRSLGSNLPAESLIAAIRRMAPAAVVLWSQLGATADIDVLRSLPRTRPRYRLFVAGPGWTEAALPPRTVLLDSLAEASATIGAAVQV